MLVPQRTPSSWAGCLFHWLLLFVAAVTVVYVFCYWPPPENLDVFSE